MREAAVVGLLVLAGIAFCVAAAVEDIGDGSELRCSTSDTVPSVHEEIAVRHITVSHKRQFMRDSSRARLRSVATGKSFDTFQRCISAAPEIFTDCFCQRFSNMGVSMVVTMPMISSVENSD